MTAKKELSTRDRLRAATLGEKRVFRRVEVEYGGNKFELRQPSIRMRQRMNSKCTDGKVFEFEMFVLYAIIECTYVPGTDERVFGDADFDTIVDAPPGGFLDALIEAILPLLNVEDERKKKSPTTRKRSSSTK